MTQVALIHEDTGMVKFVAAADETREAVGPWSVIEAVPAAPFKADAWERIKLARGEAMQDNVIVPGILEDDGDAEFQLRPANAGELSGYDFIMGRWSRALVVLAADGDFTRAFTLADNRTMVFDAAQWLLIGDHIELVLGQRFARALVLKARIDAATTKAALDAITWTLEDPE